MWNRRIATTARLASGVLAALCMAANHVNQDILARVEVCHLAAQGHAPPANGLVATLVSVATVKQVGLVLVARRHQNALEPA